jgi:uncharacterized membrane protein YidH (DUF202 family)
LPITLGDHHQLAPAENTMTRRFPRGPILDGESPFRDASGNNPFADSNSTQSLPGQDAYASPLSGQAATREAGNYEAVLPSRSGLALGLGIPGLILSILAAFGTISAIASERNAGEGLSLGIPIALLAIAMAIPGWIIAQSDCRAMRAGAMQTTHRRGTRVGYGCSVTATIVSAAVLLALPVLIVISML